MEKKIWMWVGALMLCISLCACQKSAVMEDNAQNRFPANLIRVPLTRQATNYTCGVAALQSFLYYYGTEIREDEMAADLKSDPEVGTPYQNIVAYAQSLGHRVEVKQNMTIQDLQSWIDRRQPVLVLIQAWPDSPVNWAEDWNDGHYVIAVGYDQEKIYFMDPSTLGNYTFIPIPEFMDRWHDTDGNVKLVHFGMIISKDQTGYDPYAILPLN